MLPQATVRVLTALVVLIALLLFAALFTFAIVQVWQSGSRPAYSEGFLYVATGLATLVGGVMAVAFNVRPPGGQPSPNPAPTAGPMLPGPVVVIHAIADQLPAILATAYVAVYLVVGVAAITTWVARPDVTSDLVKNLATTFLGLVLPIVGSFFRISQP